MPHTTPNERFAIAQRRQQVAQLYIQGKNLHEIAEVYHVNASTICRDLKIIRKQWKETTTFDLDEAKAVELRRLDRVLHEFNQAWEKSKTMRPPGNARYLDGIVACIKERCKILGLHAPVGVDVRNNGSPVTINVIEELVSVTNINPSPAHLPEQIGQTVIDHVNGDKEDPTPQSPTELLPQ